VRSIVSRPSPIAAEQPRDTRARALAFAIRCFEAKKEAAPESRPDDAERGSNEIGANRSIPR